MGGGFDISLNDSSRAAGILAGHVGELNDQNMGSEVELVKRIRGAQLFLVDGEESVLMQSGDFSLRLLKQAHSPLAAVVASVGEVQWPVGKDAPILKVWSRRYTFALPGLVYGVLFPESTPAIVLQLESVMDQYCTFEIHQEIAYAAQRQIAANGGRDVAKYWTAVAPDVEITSSRIARQICSTSSIVADSIMMGGKWATSGIHEGGAFVKRKVGSGVHAEGDNHVNPRILKRIQQARRMSAVAKLMSKTLLKGAISVSTHVATGLGLDVHTPITLSSLHPSAAGVEAAVGSAKPMAVASVDAFAKVVEAVETTGKSLYAATKAVGTDLVQQRFGTDAGQMVEDSFGVVGNAIDTAWTLNKFGLRMLLQATAASTLLSKSTTATKTKKPYTTTTTPTNNLQQQQPAAPSMHLFPLAKSEQQQAGSAAHQTLQSTTSHQQEQAGSAMNLATAAGSGGQANLFPSSENYVSNLPQTQIFLGPVIQQPNTVSSFTPTATPADSYMQDQPKNVFEASAAAADSYIPQQPGKNAFDAAAANSYISHQQPKNAFEQFNLFQNYDQFQHSQASSASPSFNFPFSLNRKE